MTLLGRGFAAERGGKAMGWRGGRRAGGVSRVSEYVSYRTGERYVYYYCPALPLLPARTITLYDIVSNHRVLCPLDEYDRSKILHCCDGP